MVDSSQRLALALHRSTALVDRVADSYLRPAHGIGLSTFIMLITIDAIGPANQVQIAKAMNVSRAAVTQRMKEFMVLGLVDVVPDATDVRANSVDLSAAGAELLADAWKGLAASDDGLEDGLDLDALQSALDRLILNAERYLDQKERER